MNEIYAKRNGETISTPDRSTAVKALDKLLKSQKESRERSAQIIEHYKSRNMKNAR